MRSNASTVAQYVSELPADRRAAIEAVRQVILGNLPAGYEEVMNWGMITYQVPLETYPDTYNGVRFRKLGDLPLALVGESIALLGVEEFVAQVEEARSVRKSSRARRG